MSTITIGVLIAITVFGFAVLRSPRLYRVGVVSFCSLALLSVLVISYMGPRLALAHFKAVGGSYNNDLSLFLASVNRVGLLFYAVIVMSVVFLGLIALRILSLQGPKREA